MSQYGWPTGPDQPPPPGYTSTYGTGPAGPAFGVRPAYAGVNGLRTALTVLFVISSILGLGVVAVALSRRSKYHDLLGDGDMSLRDFTTLDDADSALGGLVALWLALAVAIAVCLIIWSFRVARNTRAFGRSGQQWKAGWAIGGWFIPFANWVIPYLVLHEAWKASDPDPALTPAAQWSRTRGLSLVWWWMATGLFATGSVFVPRRFAVDVRDSVGDVVDKVDRATGFLAFWMATSIVAAVFAILVLKAITDRQEKARTALIGSVGLLGAPPGVGPPPPPLTPPGSPFGAPPPPPPPPR